MDLYDLLKKSAEDYRAEWPKRCPKCLGWGGHTSYQSHGPGMTETVWDPCECIEAGQCPRCASMNPGEWAGEEPCLVCGWRFTTPGETIIDEDG